MKVEAKPEIFEQDGKNISTNKYPHLKSQVDHGSGIVRPRLEWNVPFDFASLEKKKKSLSPSSCFRTVTRQRMVVREQRETLASPQAYKYNPRFSAIKPTLKNCVKMA